ncbi:MAG: AI-2E family transporter [Spirochaetes bacterium]|nr:AI-2E family transporter [Spirochaetota bacterium]MBN2770697.1 AI-2E family transporter [Spirochaetota bacterium]
MEKNSNILLILLVFVVFYLLATLQSILIPLTLALLFALMFQPLIIFLDKKRVPGALIVPILSILTLTAIFVVINIVVSSVSQIFSAKDFFAERFSYKMTLLIDMIESHTQSPLNIKSIVEQALTHFDTSLISSTAGSIVGRLSSFAGSFVMFSIYFIVLLSGMANYKRYLIHVGGKKSAKLLISNYETIQKSIFSYLTIKTFIGLATATLIGIVLTMFGIKFALLFAFLTFLLNFIPTFGSIAAAFPPIIMAIIQYDTFTKPIAIMIILLALQLTMGNFVEPKLLGNRLRLNTVTVIFGLVFWGYLWGIPGMILSVPLMVVLKLTFEYIPSTRIFARLMSYPEKKKIKIDPPDPDDREISFSSIISDIKKRAEKMSAGFEKTEESENKKQ